MSWMDGYYDSTAGYLYSLDAAAALNHDTRSSAWYAIGLLARDDGEDVSNAEMILTNIIQGQYKDPRQQWYVECCFWRCSHELNLFQVRRLPERT